MADAAKKEGINLYVLSGFRSFKKQKHIWESKFHSKKYSSIKDMQKRVKKILEYSAAPGSSRHHWGTEVDIVFSRKKFSLKNSFYEKGMGKKVYHWLQNNAKKYGFCQPYQLDVDKRNELGIKNGYLEEKWHWSYFPIANPLYQEYIKKYPFPFSSFSGYAIAKQYILDYVHNIHTSCFQ